MSPTAASFTKSAVEGLSASRELTPDFSPTDCASAGAAYGDDSKLFHEFSSNAKGKPPWCFEVPVGIRNSLVFRQGRGSAVGTSGLERDGVTASGGEVNDRFDNRVAGIGPAAVGRACACSSKRRLCEAVNLNLAYCWFYRLGSGGQGGADHFTMWKDRHGRFRESDASAMPRWFP